MAVERAAGDTTTALVESAEAPAEQRDEGLPPGIGPYRLALRRLRRNRVALAFGALFLLILILCLLAPVYSHDIAHIGPNDNNLEGKVKVGGQLKDVVNGQGVGIGPTWHSRYFFGAVGNGRDVAVRLLYGGRNSLEIGLLASLITIFFATLFGMVAGFVRGFTDGVIARVFDIVWSYPVVILALALGTALSLYGIKIGPVKIHPGLLIPAIIIGFVYIPYVGKPIRGQVLSLREKEFVDAARAQGAGPWRIMFSEILPNVASTVIVFVPLIVANAILLEAALSFLGAGVQPPNPSWGNMISDGVHLIPAGFHLTLVPGVMLILAVLGINVFGDGVRDALDPRARIRIEY